MTVQSTSAAIESLLDLSRGAAPDEVPTLVSRTSAAFGASAAMVYLADLQQRSLVPLTGPDVGPGDGLVRVLDIESTVAGHTFQHGTSLVQADGPPDGVGPVRAWLPLSMGTERLGVLGVTLDAAPEDDVALAALERYASVVGEIVAHLTLFGDALVRARRSSTMSLAAEIQWSLLPPLTFVGSAVTVAGGLEPAYEIAGDSLDYSVSTRTTHFAVLDGMGHGIVSAQLISLAVAAYRNARRARRSLPDTVSHMEAAVSEVFRTESFATGVLCELDTVTGLLTWVSAGHQAPLLFRDGELERSLEVEPLLPFGLNLDLGGGAPAAVGVEQLLPGDVVVCYTDGVTDARSPDGTFFGQDRLVRHVADSARAGLPSSESVRRLVQALLEHQSGDLADDATVLQVTWHGPTTPHRRS